MFLLFYFALVLVSQINRSQLEEEEVEFSSWETQHQKIHFWFIRYTPWSVWWKDFYLLSFRIQCLWNIFSSVTLYVFSAAVSHLLLWNCSIIYCLPTCTEVASCTCIRHLLLQFNMGVSLLFSESNKKRISFHSSKKYGFISFRSKTDPVAVKCHTHTHSSVFWFLHNPAEWRPWERLTIRSFLRQLWQV